MAVEKSLPPLQNMLQIRAADTVAITPGLRRHLKRYGFRLQKIALKPLWLIIPVVHHKEHVVSSTYFAHGPFDSDAIKRFSRGLFEGN